MNSHTNMLWFLHPKRDDKYQWWWGYQKVKMVRLPESEKQKYIEKMRGTK